MTFVENDRDVECYTSALLRFWPIPIRTPFQAISLCAGFPGLKARLRKAYAAAGQSAEPAIIGGRAVARRRRPGLISVRPPGDWNAHKNNVQTPIALQARLREGGRLGDATLPKLRRWRGVACNALTGSCRQLPSRRRGHTAGKSFRRARKNHPLGEAIRRSRSIPLPEPESLRNL